MDDEWLATARAHHRALSMVVDGEAEVLVDDEPRLAMLEGPIPESHEAVLLGVDDDRAIFARGSGLPRAASSHRFAHLREVGADLPARDGVLAAQALGIFNWHRRNGFCGTCGGPTTMERAGYARRCDDCGDTAFPRTDPAVIMLPVAAGQCLLCRRYGRTHWSSLAGFIEPGESLEAGVAREVAEETALTTIGVEYVGSQPWPFPGQIMLGFEAEVEHAEPVLNEELEEYRWWEPEALRKGLESGEVDLASRVSIGRALVERWLARH